MKTFSTILATCLFLISSTVFACPKEKSEEKLHLESSETMKVSMLVESVDYASREIVLKDSSGELIPYTADEEMINLAQLNAGDIVLAEYTENFYIDVVEAEGAKPSEGD